MRVRAIASILVAGAALAACGTVDSGVTAKRVARQRGQAPAPTTVDTEPTTDSTPDTNPTRHDATPRTRRPDDTTLDTIPPDKAIPVPDDQNVIDFGDAKTQRDYDGFLVVAFKDIESFWNEHSPSCTAATFQPLEGRHLRRLPGADHPDPRLPEPARPRYDDVEGNAFYCSDGDFIVYDDDQLLPELVKELGAERPSASSWPTSSATPSSRGSTSSTSRRSSRSSRPTASPAPGLRTSPAARTTS